MCISYRQTQNSKIARICRYKEHRRQNTPGKAKLCLFRDFSGYFEPFGNFSYISYISHTNNRVGPLWFPTCVASVFWPQTVSGKVKQTSRDQTNRQVQLFIGVTRDRIDPLTLDKPEY